MKIFHLMTFEARLRWNGIMTHNFKNFPHISKIKRLKLIVDTDSRKLCQQCDVGAKRRNSMEPSCCRKRSQSFELNSLLFDVKQTL